MTEPTTIHPTALVHPRAQLGVGCQIGPYCIIGEHVVLGDRTRVHSHAVIDGHSTLGRENEVYPFVTIGLKTQDLKWKGGVARVQIGDFNTFREHVSVHSATEDGDATVIGSHNNLLIETHIAHDVTLGNHIIISKAALAGHIVVEDYAVIGGMAAVHQFCRIGTMAMIGGCSKIVQDVAPYMIVDGNPAETRTINKIGLERNGVSEGAQAGLKQAYKLLFREGLTISNALVRIEADVPQCPEVAHLVHFARASERGLTK